MTPALASDAIKQMVALLNKLQAAQDAAAPAVAGK